MFAVSFWLFLILLSKLHYLEKITKNSTWYCIFLIFQVKPALFRQLELWRCSYKALSIPKRTITSLYFLKLALNNQPKMA